MEILEVDEKEARAYKAILYEAIKKEKEQLSNYDKAMELERQASDSAVLKKITKSEVKKMMKTIEEKHSMKNSSSTDSASSVEKGNRFRIENIALSDTLTSSNDSSDSVSEYSEYY